MSMTDFKLSRTGLEDFIKCPRCFKLQRGMGLKGLRMVPLTLAVATDALLKNEFDLVRESGDSHPLWEREGLDVRGFAHPDLELWRNNFKGIRVLHEPSGCTVYGAVDDVWQHRQTDHLHIVDYKSTSKQGTPDLESGFGAGYKRQMEIYQWLFRQAGFEVSPIGYFLYVNGSKEGRFYESGLRGTMQFETTVLAHEGDDSWVEETIIRAVACLKDESLPVSDPSCDTCRYVAERSALTM
ncbi:MAG: PD-(D/E)XK nuclease family protein [Gammaproteobacteria bacterium]|nr:PD-(D/E)XK nuclease family protein [Gammaproteobacteria bacterium]